MRGLHRATQPLRAAIRMMVARVVVLLVDDAPKLQGLQVSVLADETREGVERFQQYGFTSHPLPGAEGIAVGVSGSRDHLVVLAVDDRRYRLKSLQAGEVAIYTDEGDKIVLKRGGVIELTSATKVSIVAPLVETTGHLQVAGNISSGGNITAAGDVADQGGAKTMAGMRAAYNPHTHGASPPPGTSM
jgi:phage baseplate assembly protein V